MSRHQDLSVNCFTRTGQLLRTRASLIYATDRSVSRELALGADEIDPMSEEVTDVRRRPPDTVPAAGTASPAIRRRWAIGQVTSHRSHQTRLR